MARTIYSDSGRSFAVSESSLIITNSSGERSVPLSAMVRSALRPNEIAALHKAGYDPAGWYALESGKLTFAICPPETQAAVESALDEYRQAQEAARKDPARIEYNRIERLRFDAQRHVDDDLDAYHSGMARARREFEAWKQKYPEAAKRLRRAQLRTEAEELKTKAKGALLYDADGSLTAEMQQQRYDEFMAEAQAKIDEADAL